MNHSSSATQQGLPPLPPHTHHQASLQQPRTAPYIQSHRPHSPQHSSLHAAQQGSYVSPHSSSHSLNQHTQSPYIGSAPGISQQHSGEAGFFGAHPSPYSANSGTASYASSEPSDSMATQAAMNRQHYTAPMSSYQTPQSTSSTSMHSPQTDGHGRPLYGMPSMAQSMYYAQPYHQIQQQASPYAQHPSTSHHSSITSAPGMLLSHTQPQHSLVHHQNQAQHTASTHSPSTGMMESKPSPSSLQRPPSVVGGSHSTPQTPSGPAPGPIPATTPLVVRQDGNGVQWIAFEYSRDRVKMEYTIRCDVESVDVDSLPQDFKTSNCVYPRACVGKDQYKGNRHHYETECNTVGWALAQLNPPLREKRGLIQRAVDSWRNSNQDPRLRSRRVRRMAKLNNRKAAQMQHNSPLAGHQGSQNAGLQPPQGMPPNARAPSHLGSSIPPMHSHHNGNGGEDVSSMFHHM